MVPGDIVIFGLYTTPPFFLKATQHKDFKKLAVITGIESAKNLKDAIIEEQNRLSSNYLDELGYNTNFVSMLKLNNFDTLNKKKGIYRRTRVI